MPDQPQPARTYCRECGDEAISNVVSECCRRRVRETLQTVIDTAEKAIAERDRYRAALEEISGMPATGGVAAAAMIEVADEALGEGGQHEH